MLQKVKFIGLGALFALIASLAFEAGAAPAPVKNPEQKKEEPKKEEPKKAEEPADLFDQLFPPRPGDFAERLKQLPPGAFDPEPFKQMQRQMEEAQKRMEEARKEMDRAFQQMRLNRRPGLAPMGLRGQVETRLGAQLQAPSPTLVQQLDLPENQGLVIENLQGESAAAKAGLKQHDVLLELGGKAVPSSVRAFQTQLNEIKPDQAVDAVVLRKGKKETIKGLKLPEAKEVPFGPPAIRFNFPNFPAPGIPGAGFPGNIPGLPGLPGIPGGKNVVVSTIRNGDNFTTNYQEGDLKIELKGKVEQGKDNVESISIDESGTKTSYDSVDKVPEQYRDKVKKLLGSTGNNGARPGAKPVF
jgi:hypothetical protein